METPSKPTTPTAPAAQKPPATVGPTTTLTAEQALAWAKGLQAENEQLKKQVAAPGASSAPQIVGEGYVLQMSIRGYDGLGREVMWNIRGRTIGEFDQAFASKAEHINKLQSIRPAKSETTATNGEGEAVPNCAIHHTPMVKRSKDGRTWWSCAEKLEDGQWCNYRPKK